MKSIFLTFSVYLAFARKSFQRQMQYRVANMAGLTTNFFFLLIHIFVYTAFYAGSIDPQPLNLDEIITYFVLCQVFFMLMPFWGARSEITGAIKSGAVSLQLTKPVDFQAYWFANEGGKAFYFLFMRGLPTFLVSILFLEVAIPKQHTVIIAFIGTMMLSILMSIALTTTIFSSAFWTLDTSGISGISFSIITLFSGMLVPIALLPDWLAHVSRWLPFEGLIDIPFSIYLGKITGIEIWFAMAKQMVWCLFFIATGRMLLNRGFTRLVIQGG